MRMKYSVLAKKDIALKTIRLVSSLSIKSFIQVEPF
jgi:hypothetical protein